MEGLTQRGVAVSIDTSKSGVAKSALECGAAVVNDITSLSDPEMADICAKAGSKVCLMHMQGTPSTMQQNPHYTDVVEEIEAYCS